MLISYNWLKELIPSLSASPEEVAEALSQSLAEVEKPKPVGNDFVLGIDNKALSVRGDCLSQIGLAREVAAIYNLRLEKPPIPKEEELQPSSTTLKSLTPLAVRIENPIDCLRYAAVKLSNLQTRPSPQWLINKLISLGARPINNLVDITNFVMLEMGQPLHAFDAEKLLADPKITIEIRRAKPEEKIKTLDGAERNLTNGDLVIASNLPNTPNHPNTPVALAGIMGGFDSAVSDKTTTIILESANFNPTLIRQTSQRLNLRTEASSRFEKNQDANQTMPAILRAIELYKDLANAKVDSLIIDEYPNIKEPPKLPLDIGRISRFLGTELSANQIFQILQSLEMTIEKKNDRYSVSVPSFRKDVMTEEDLFEEVGRLSNYNKITPTLPNRSLKSAQSNFSWELQKQVSENLKSFGFNEIYTYSFVGEKLLSKCLISTDGLAELRNPLSPELQFLRPTLLLSLLEKAVLNKNNSDSFSLFETSLITPTINNRQPNSEGLFNEPKSLGLIIFDLKKSEKELFFDLKGVLEKLGQVIGLSLGFEQPEKTSQRFQAFDQTNTLMVTTGDSNQSNSTLGLMGPINPLVKRNLAIDNYSVAAAEIDLNLIQKGNLVAPSLKPISPFSPIINDLSIIIRSDQNYQQIFSELTDTIKILSSLKVDIDFKDMYQEKSGQRVLTFRLIFNSYEKQLAQEETNKLLKKAKEEMTKKLGVGFK